MVSSDPGDKLLIERAQGDLRRFAELYEAHFDRIYAFIARRVSRREDAQDLTAEVFHQALANLGRYEWRRVPFAAWLYPIAANAVADHHARETRARAMPPDADADPPDGVEEAEQRAALYGAVRALPPDQRQVIERSRCRARSISTWRTWTPRTPGLSPPAHRRSRHPPASPTASAAPP